VCRHHGSVCKIEGTVETTLAIRWPKVFGFQECELRPRPPFSTRLCP